MKTSTLLALLCLCAVEVSAQEITSDERLTQLEQKLQEQTEKNKFMPQIHGILRGKYEYEPDLDASRFEIRNARLSVDGSLPLRSSYKLEVEIVTGDEEAKSIRDNHVQDGTQNINTLLLTVHILQESQELLGSLRHMIRGMNKFVGAEA